MVVPFDHKKMTQKGWAVCVEEFAERRGFEVKLEVDNE